MTTAQVIMPCLTSVPTTKGAERVKASSTILLVNPLNIEHSKNIREIGIHRQIRGFIDIYYYETQRCIIKIFLAINPFLTGLYYYYVHAIIPHIREIRFERSMGVARISVRGPKFFFI